MLMQFRSLLIVYSTQRKREKSSDWICQLQRFSRFLWTISKDLNCITLKIETAESQVEFGCVHDPECFKSRAVNARP